jgi:large subunit ribosomal protein L19
MDCKRLLIQNNLLINCNILKNTLLLRSEKPNTQNIIVMDLMKVVNELFANKKEVPAFKAGDTVTVHYKIVEGSKERIQQYKGVVIERKGIGHTATFTVRKMSGDVGVERIFPISSPFIDKIEVNKFGKVRRAKIFYLRDLTGKKARIQEKRATI